MSKKVEINTLNQPQAFQHKDRLYIFKCHRLDGCEAFHLKSGSLTFFSRSTRVEPVELHITVKEKP